MAEEGQKNIVPARLKKEEDVRFAVFVFIAKKQKKMFSPVGLSSVSVTPSCHRFLSLVRASRMTARERRSRRLRVLFRLPLVWLRQRAVCCLLPSPALWRRGKAMASVRFSHVVLFAPLLPPAGWRRRSFLLRRPSDRCHLLSLDCMFYRWLWGVFAIFLKLTLSSLEHSSFFFSIGQEVEAELPGRRLFLVGSNSLVLSGSAHVFRFLHLTMQWVSRLPVSPLPCPLSSLFPSFCLHSSVSLVPVLRPVFLS